MTMPRRHLDEFQKQAELHNITHWLHHDCAICGEWTAFVFVDGKVYFDSTCGCSSYPTAPQPYTWNDVADHYNIQTSPIVIAQMDEFWHFDA